MIAAVINIIVVGIVAVCIAVLCLAGKGGTFTSRIRYSFHRLLVWADADIERPSMDKKIRTSSTKESNKANALEETRTEILAAINNSQKEIESIILDKNKLFYDELIKRLSSLDLEVSTLSEDVQKLSLQKGNHVDSFRNQNTDETTENKVRNYPYIRFGKLADSMMPIGFVDSNLKTSPNGCCFVITVVSATEARFRLATDLAMRQEALQMFNPIISTACEYDEKPAVINDAMNIEDGVLNLNNGVWCITKKNKINLI